MKEPKPRNSNGVKKNVWSRWKVNERHFFNKMYSYMLFHKEVYSDVPMTTEQWELFCLTTCEIATDTYRRTNLISKRNF